MEKQQHLVLPADYARANRIKMAIILGMLTSFGPVSMDMYLPGLPALAADLNTSVSLAQLSLTFCLLGLAAGQLLGGSLSDIYGRRRPVMVALIIYMAASVLCALSTSIEVLLVFRLLQGLAGAICIVTARAIVRDLYSGPSLTQFMALLAIFQGATPILAPVAGGQLLRVTDWHGIFLILAGIGVFIFATIVKMLPETLEPGRRLKGSIFNAISVYAKLLRNPAFIGCALTQGFISGAMFAYISGSTFVLQHIFGMSPQLFSLTFAINGAGIILASQIAGKLAVRISEYRLLFFGVCVALTGGISLFLATITEAGLWAVLIALFLTVSSVGVTNTAGFSLAMQSQGKNAGSASALLGVFFFVLGAIAAPLVGLGGNETAMPMAVVILTAHLFSFASFMLLVRKYHPKEGSKA